MVTVAEVSDFTFDAKFMGETVVMFFDDGKNVVLMPVTQVEELCRKVRLAAESAIRARTLCPFRGSTKGATT